jgi:hypothetical protein
MAGHAVADVIHLLAELIENATCFSPPAAVVRVRSHAADGRGARCVLTVEDCGFGMGEDALALANQVLSRPPDLDLRDRKLGFQVVGRLAQRYGVQVRLVPTPGGGITAVVTLPDALVTERPMASTRLRFAGVAGVAGVAPVSDPVSAPAAGLVDGPVGGFVDSRLGGLGDGFVDSRLDDLVGGLGDGQGGDLHGGGVRADVLTLPPTAEPGPAPAVRSSSLRTHRAHRHTSTERDRRRVMLSRFQAAQRAGKAVATAPAGSLTHGTGLGRIGSQEGV